MTPALRETLVAVAGATKQAVDPWWIIGSAEVALVGGEVRDVRDVDVLMSRRDAHAFLRRVGSAPATRDPDALFRSEVFGTWNEPPLAVDVMGGFSLFSGGMWRPVSPGTREPVGIQDQTLFVPSREELRALLLDFGREKDIARAALIAG